MIDRQSRTRRSLDARAAVLATACVHAGDFGRRHTHALDAPIVLSSAFGFASAEEAADAFQGKNEAYIYGRWRNPTVGALEAKLAVLEGTEDACVTASGMSAVSGAVLAFCTQERVTSWRPAPCTPRARGCCASASRASASRRPSSTRRMPTPTGARSARQPAPSPRRDPREPQPRPHGLVGRRPRLRARMAC